MKLTLCLAAAILAAQTCGTATSEPIVNVKLETDGGITGRGLGSVAIDNRSVTARDMRRTCNGTLNDAEEKQLRELLERVPSGDWKSYGGGHPDAIRYTLTVGTRTASWYGEEPAELPGALRTAGKTLWSVRNRVLADCPE